MKRIILCLDGSIESVKAGRFLARMVHDEAYELTVLSILPKPVGPGDLHQETKRSSEYVKAAYNKVQQYFVGANVQIQHLIRFGRTGQKIVSVAESLDADLLIMGAVGHSMVARMLLGSTSDYVATHAHCSVVVVRPGELTGLQSARGRIKIALAYEQTGPARAAFEEIIEFQWGRETQLDLLTVVADRIDFTDDGAEQSQTHRENAQTTINRLREELSGVAPVNAGVLLESNHTGDAIVQFAETNGTDLLIVGETHQTKAGRILLGSVSRFVLRHAPCSIWITRNRKIRGIAKKSVQASDLTARTSDIGSGQDSSSSV